MNEFTTTRRRLLGGTAAASLWSAAAPVRTLGQGLAAGAAALGAVASQGAAPTDRITVLYRPESPKSPSRVDPVIQGVTRALEAEFLRAGFVLVQPAPEVLELMDKGQQVVVTFAEDAGFTMVYSAYTDVRPAPGQEAGIGEVRLSGRVFVGRRTLSVEDGRGQMFTRLEPEVREFGIRRALELAGQRAAGELANRTANTLRAIPAAQLAQWTGATPSTATTHVVVPLPPAGTPALPPAPPAPAPVAPPSAASAAPVTPPPLAAPPVPVVAAPPAPVVAPPAAPPAAAPARPIGNRWGIVVAMSDYSVVRNANGFRPDQLSDLKGVRKDFANACSALQSMGFDERRVAAFLDEQCTSAGIKGMLKQLAGKVQPDDLVVVFISAHGGDKQFSASRFGMPILADYRPGDPNNLDFWELQGLLKNLPGRVVWINDTCHSGGAATNMTSVEVGSRGIQVVEGVKGPDAGAAAGGAPGQDFAVLTACRPSEVSWEDGERGGLFASRMFQELVARRGTTPLERIFRDYVYPAVVDRSRQICSRTKSCEQQTPVMAYQGGGGTLLL